jgi:predicted SAM-dependent methyltransferase
MSRVAKMDLERIVFIGRTFEEYLQMFNLSPEQIIGKSILDCPSGACSFTAGANRNGGQAMGVDIAYAYAPEELARKGKQDIVHAMLQLEKVRDNYIWNEFKSIDELRQARIEALDTSTRDRMESPERYVHAALPELPFHDRSFDLILSAHFLFMYGDRLDYDFHVQALQELLRVTKGELRIFPLTDLSCNRYEHLDRLLEETLNGEYIAEEVRVPYEFQKGANHMLRISRIKG